MDTKQEYLSISLTPRVIENSGQYREFTLVYNFLEITSKFFLFLTTKINTLKRKAHI